MSDISIQFNNSSGTITFKRAAYGSHLGLLGNYEQQPDTTLVAITGLQTVSANFTGKDGVIAKATMWCCWHDPASDYIFGIMIQIDAQVVHTGFRPYYKTTWAKASEISDPNDENSYNWGKQDPSSPVTIAGDAYNKFPFHVDISPDSQGQQLNLSATVNDN